MASSPDHGARARDRGVALVIVLLITALVSVLAATMLARHRLVLTRAQQATAGAQAYEYALGAESYARQLLHQDHEQSPQPRTDTLSDVWAQPLSFPIDEGTLQIAISDAAAQMNVNALAVDGPNPANARVRNLLFALGVDENAVEVLRDWVDADDANSGFGAEDAEYLLRKPPHRAANTLFADVSELQIVGDLDQEVRASLRRELIALPTPYVNVNVNTATASALLSLSRQLSPTEAQAIAEGDRAYQDPAAVVAEFPALAPAVAAIRVASDFFAVRVRVDYGGATVHLTSLVHRDPNNGQTLVLSRNLGERYFLTDGTAAADADDERGGTAQ